MSPLAAGELTVKVNLDDAKAKDQIKAMQKDGIELRTTSDKTAEKFKEAATKLTSASNRIKQMANYLKNWWNQRMPNVFAKMKTIGSNAINKIGVGRLFGVGMIGGGGGGGLLAAVGGAAGVITAISVALPLIAQVFTTIARTIKRAVEGIINFAKESAKATKAYETFSNVVENKGMKAEAVLRRLEQAVNYSVNRETLMKMSTYGLAAGVDIDQIEKLLVLAKKTSAASGLSVEESFQRLMKGPIKGSVEILDDTLVRVVNIDKAYKDYATSVGKTVDELTEQEMLQVRVNATLANGEKITKDLGVTTTKSADNITKFGVALDNLKLSLKIEFGKMISGITEAILRFADSIKIFISNHETLAKYLKETMEFILHFVSWSIDALDALLTGLDALFLGLSGNMKAAGEQYKRFKALSFGGKVKPYVEPLLPGAEQPKIQNAHEVKKITEEQIEFVKKLKEETLSANESAKAEYELMVKRAKAIPDIKIRQEALNYALTIYNNKLKQITNSTQTLISKEDELKVKFQERIDQANELDKRNTDEMNQFYADNAKTQTDLETAQLGDSLAAKLRAIDIEMNEALKNTNLTEQSKTNIIRRAMIERDKIRREFETQVKEDKAREQQELEEALRKEAELEIERVEQTTSILEAEDEKKKELHEKELSRMEELKQKGKEMFDEILSIFSRSGSFGSGILSFIGSQFSGMFLNTAGNLSAAADASRDLKEEGVSISDIGLSDSEQNDVFDTLAGYGDISQKTAKNAKAANKGLGSSFKQLGADIIDSLKQQAIVQAIMETAAGFAALARLDFSGAALHFTSAALYGTVAALQIASAIGAGSGGGGRNTNSSQAPYAEGQQLDYNLNDVNPAQPVTVNINAMDAQSFDEFAKRNSSSFGKAVNSVVKNNQSTRRGLARGLA